MNRRNKGNMGFALLLVLMLIAVATIVAVTYAGASSVKLAGTNNLLKASRARYLAESGLQQALYVLQTSPDTIANSSADSPVGPFQADDSDDSYVFYLSQTRDANVYVIASIGTAGGIAQSAAMVVQLSPDSGGGVSQGLYVGSGNVSLPASVTVNGDVHVNGNLTNRAVVNGDVSASGTVSDLSGGISGSTSSGSEQVEQPNITIDDYLTYNFDGVSGSAVEVTEQVFNHGSQYSGDGAITADNPGGVIIIRPKKGNTIKIVANVDFTGTILIDGNVELGTPHIGLTAVDGFPCIIATGKITIGNSTRAEMNGVVVAGGGFIARKGATHRSRTTVNGALIAESIGIDAGLNGSHIINYDADLCRLLGFSSGSGGSGTLRILTWMD